MCARMCPPASLPLPQVCSLEGQLAITQDELTQKDAHLEVLRCEMQGMCRAQRHRCAARVNMCRS